jgi:hypothetical protein
MNGYCGDDSAKLKATLVRLGEVLFFVAVLALGTVSLGTSFAGLKTLMPGLQAVLAAFGLQSSMIAASILLARSHRFRQKLLFIVACVFTAGTSIFFSYVGLRAVLARQVADVRAPQIEKQHLSDEQTRLQEAALSLRGRALARLESDKTTAIANLDVASANRDVRELEARDYQLDLRTIHAEQIRLTADVSLSDEERAARLMRLQAQERRDHRLLEIASAAGEKLELDAAENRVSGQNLQTVRDQLIASVPDFQSAKDWPTLRASYDKLGAVWGQMPLDFQSANPLPPPPSLTPLFENGRPTVGRDHPVVEAAWSITNLRDPSDIFSLVLAVLFDGIGLISIFATMGGNRKFPDRLAELRRWMAATTWQAQMMPGVLPWLGQTFRDVLWAPQIRLDDPRIAALEDTLIRLRQEMDEFLGGLRTSPNAFEGISVQLASLFSRANVIAFDSGEKLKNLALRSFGMLRDAIEGSTLAEADKEKARDFIQRQSARFTSAVNDCFAD